MTEPVLVEACVDSLDGALAAARAGAGRIELCAGLIEGGTTPSAGLMALAGERSSVPVFTMIRPRGGDFLYSPAELEIMLRDIAVARRAGTHGIVIGALTPDGSVDVEATRALVGAAAPLPVTFHRAFDLTRDLTAALDALIACGVQRVLTSGGARRAGEDIDMLASLVARAAGRIVVMAGGGISAETAAAIVDRTGVRELHVGGAVMVPSAMTFRRSEISFARAPMPDEYTLAVADEGRLRRVVEAISRG
jgi:copper homeostasis protein